MALQDSMTTGRDKNMFNKKVSRLWYTDSPFYPCTYNYSFLTDRAQAKYLQICTVKRGQQPIMTALSCLWEISLSAHCYVIARIELKQNVEFR
jgi:hypothetical protein